MCLSSANEVKEISQQVENNKKNAVRADIFSFSPRINKDIIGNQEVSERDAF